MLTFLKEIEPPSLFHHGPEEPRTPMLVLGHSLLHSLVHFHHSLIRLLHPARFARMLCCAHLFARSLTYAQARGKVND